MTKHPSALAASRMAAGHSQESLAEQVGVERSTVARWEHGESRPQPWARRKLAEALSLSLQQVDGLISGTSHEPDQRTRVAICGSRTEDANGEVIDAVIPVLARHVMASGLDVNHGPVGVGIEVMTYIADRFRPPGFTMTPSLFGRQSIVRDAACVLVIGGGAGTADEVSLAVSMGVLVLPFPRSGGTAQRFYESARMQRRARTAIPAEAFAKLAECDDVEDYVMLVQQVMNEGGQDSR